MQSQKFSISAQVKSFSYAFMGIKKFFFAERNAAIHLVATVLVIISALVLHVSINDAIALVIAVGLVWMAEMFNTCIERIMNFISIDEHPEIRFIKDVSAAAVLIASGTAFFIGLFVFIPKIL